MGIGRNADRLFRQRNPGVLEGREAASRTRSTRLAGAAQQFRSPSLSGAQSSFVGGVRSGAGIKGLFGGAVNTAVDRTRTQFLAGNRLSGLQGLLEGAVSPIGGVEGDVNQTRLTPELLATLSQIGALNTQFQFGGQAGRENVANLDPGAVGAAGGRSGSQNLRLEGGSRLIGAQQGRLTTPGTASNNLARQFAESQGAQDTGGFIRNNPQIQASVTRAQLQGLRAPPSAFAADFRQEQSVGQDFQSVVSGAITQQNQTPRFGAIPSLFGDDLQGLASAGLIPFRDGAGSTVPALFNRDPAGIDAAAKDFFSPLLFGS